MDLAFSLFVQGVQMILVLALAPLVTGIVRKAKARLLRRRGAPIYQPYLDLIRLMRKEAVLAHNASWLFRATPYMILALTWVAASLVPTFSTHLIFGLCADFIVIVAILGSARFLLALAGMDIGTAFGGIGSSREMMIAAVAEPAMLMVVFTLAMVAGGSQLSTISAFMAGPDVGILVSLALAFVALCMLAVAENGRVPIDNPATHLELTMVHEAMVLEYSGRHLAMIELASSLKLLLYLSLIGCIFAPFGIVDGQESGFLVYMMAFGLYLGKLLLGCTALAIFEVSVAKMRVFRVPDFLGAALMLGLLAALLVFFMWGF